MQRQSPGQSTLTITGEAPEAEDSSALEHLKDDKFSSSVTTVECRNATQLQLKIATDATTRGGSTHCTYWLRPRLYTHTTNKLGQLGYSIIYKLYFVTSGNRKNMINTKKHQKHINGIVVVSVPETSGIRTAKPAVAS